MGPKSEPLSHLNLTLGQGTKPSPSPRAQPTLDRRHQPPWVHLCNRLPAVQHFVVSQKSDLNLLHQDAAMAYQQQGPA